MQGERLLWFPGVAIKLRYVTVLASPVMPACKAVPFPCCRSGGQAVEESQTIKVEICCLKPENKDLWVTFVSRLNIYIKWTDFFETVGTPGALQCSVVVHTGELSQGLIIPAGFSSCGAEPKACFDVL